MPNALTGLYDAVVQVRTETINRLLATLHQNGAVDDEALSFPHSFAVRITDRRFLMAALAAEVSGFGGARRRRGGGAEPPPPPPTSGGKKGLPPPGVSDSINDLMGEITGVAEVELPGRPRGTAQVQVAAPRISMPQGSTSEVNVHVDVRARYVPDPGTSPLPEPIHGEVRAAFTVKPNGWAHGGKTVLEVKPTDDDKKIAFTPAPGSGLASHDVNRLIEPIRRLLRENFQPTNVELDEGFKFSRFKGLGSGASETIALPVTLSGHAPSTNALSGVTNLFLDSGDHFGIAVSKEHVEGILAPMIDSLKSFTTSFQVSFWVVYIIVPVKHTVSYHVSISSVAVSWEAGAIKLTIKGQAVTSSIIAPNYSFTITQRVTITLNQTAQTLALKKDGALSLSMQASNVLGVPDAARTAARNAAEDARDDAIADAQSQIQHALTGSVDINEALHTFESSANARYTAVEITADGVILRGAVSVKARPPIVAYFTETGDETAFTAFKSWVPAGSVESFEWSWERPNPFFDIPHHHLEGTKLSEWIKEDHIFTVPVPEAVPPDGRVCLTIKGLQVPSAPGPLVPRWQSICQVIWFQRVAVQTGINWAGLAGNDQLPASVAQAIPDWLETQVTVPLWRRDPPEDGTLESSITAHVSVVDRPEAGEAAAPGASTIIHFAAPGAARPLKTLEEVLTRKRRRDASVSVTLVLPRGSFGERRGALAERLGSLSQEVARLLAVTEDYEGGWSRAFAVERPPATFLLNTEGRVVWQESGPLNAGSLVAALDEHLVAGPPAPSRPLRQTVRPGRRAPDVLVEYADGRQIAIRKLHGQRLLLLFWQSWSAPCLAELRRLQATARRGGEDTPVILAINDGEDPGVGARVRAELGLTYTMIPDPHRRIARAYGVRCWPTTVHVAANGLVAGVHLGVVHERTEDEEASLTQRAVATSTS